MKHYIYRFSDGQFIAVLTPEIETKWPYEMPEPHECYISNRKPSFGIDPEKWNGYEIADPDLPTFLGGGK